MSKIKSLLSLNKSDIIFTGIAFFLIALFNFPSLLNMSIDDVGAYTHPDPYKKFVKTWGQWKRYMSLLSTNMFSALNLSVGTYYITGWIISIFGLSVFLVKLMKFMASELNAPQRLGLVLLAALFPYMFIVFHFKLIGMSVAFVYFALFGIIWSTDKKLWVQGLFAMLAVIVIAGSYQSGLYWLIFTLVAVGIKKTLQGDLISELLKWAIYIVFGLALGLLAYSFIGSLFEAAGIKPKHAIASSSDMASLAKRNLSSKFIKFHLRDMPMFPKWLKSVSIIHLSILWVTLFYLNKNRLGAYISLPVYLIAVILGVMQILMIPYNYTHVPPRSFWFIGFAYAILAAATLSKLRTKSGKPWAFIYQFNNLAIIAVTALFAFHTAKFSYGLMDLRQTDFDQVAEISEQLTEIQVKADDKVVFYLGDSARIKARHKHVTGAVRTLFWAPWTRTQFLEYATGMKVKDAPKLGYDAAKEQCPKIQGDSNNLIVERYNDFVLICLP